MEGIDLRRLLDGLQIGDHGADHVSRSFDPDASQVHVVGLPFPSAPLAHANMVHGWEEIS